MQTHLHASNKPTNKAIFVIITLILFWTSLYIYIPIMSPLAEIRGASLSTIGYLISGYGLTQFLLRIPLGIWSDRLNKRRPFVTVGLFLSIIGALGMALSANPVLMVLFRALTGVCSSMYIMLIVIFSGAYPPDQKGKVMGIAFFITHLCQVSAGLLGGYIAHLVGQESPFIASAIVASLGLFVSLFLPEPNTKSTSSPQLTELLKAAVNPHLLGVALLGALVQFLPFVTIYGFTPVYATSLGASEVQLGWLTFASGIPMAMGSFLSTKRKSLKLSSKSIVILSLLLASTALVMFPRANRMTELMFLQMLVSFPTGLAVPTLMALSVEKTPLAQQGTALGVFQAIYALGMFLGPIIGGYLGKIFGLGGVFIGTSFIMVLGAITTALFLGRKEKKTITA